MYTFYFEFNEVCMFLYTSYPVKTYEAGEVAGRQTRTQWQS